MTTAQASILKPFLDANPAVRFIHYQYVDLGAVLREVVVIANQALIDESENKPLNCGSVLLRTFADGTFSPRFHGLGKEFIWPDWASLRLAPFWGEFHALVMCFVDEGTYFQTPDVANRLGSGGRISCPRSIITRAIAQAASDGIDIKIGFETEFFLLNKGKSEATPVEVPSSICIAAALLDEGIRKCLEAISVCLLDRGIPLWRFLSEGGKGLFELVTGPLPVLEAIDQQLYIRQAIQTIASQHGYHATLYPAPFGPNTSTSGAHCHLSLNRSDIADHFLAGILDQIPALCAFSMPISDSYSRVSEFRGQTGKWVTWGTENKDVPIRAISGREAYWELRFADFSANPYLQLGAWITAGHLGVKDKRQLRWKDCKGK
jgi:glutamine synthetase